MRLSLRKRLSKYGMQLDYNECSVFFLQRINTFSSVLLSVNNSISHLTHFEMQWFMVHLSFKLEDYKGVRTIFWHNSSTYFQSNYPESKPKPANEMEQFNNLGCTVQSPYCISALTLWFIVSFFYWSRI